MENPYRILGVYANSPKKDIVANKGRATAFLRVGKAVEYPLDLKGILPPISRTLEMFDKAEAHLAIAKEQISYAQFWFLKMTPLDDVAFNHLIAGDMAGAKEIWSKQESLSSLQNKQVCYLIENKPWLALKTAESLYGRFGDTYINKVDANSTLQMTGIELLHQFIDTLGTEVGMQKLLGYELGEEIKAYISSQTIGSLISKISAEVERAKKVDHKDSKARLEAARNLVRNTKEQFAQLKQLLPADDAQFIVNADKLGLEILQCGIDYFNNSQDADRHQTAMKVQKYAQIIVAGTLAKQRCDENVEILIGIINSLPPESIKDYAQYVNARITEYKIELLTPNLDGQAKLNCIIALLEACAPYLASIKEELGPKDCYYLKVSTKIAEIALNNTIAIVNDFTNNPKLELLNWLGGLDIMGFFSKVWDVMKLIKMLDLETFFKKDRLKPNEETLESIFSKAIVKNTAQAPLDMRSERTMYLECKTVDECDYVLKVFPEGRYRQKVKEKKREIRFSNCKTESDCDKLISDYPQMKEEIEELREKVIFQNCESYGKCKKYILFYPKGKYVKQVEQKMSDLVAKELDNCHTVEEYENFLQLYSDSQYIEEAQKRLTMAKRKRNRQKVMTVVKGVLAIAVTLGIIWFAFWYSEYEQKQYQQKIEQEERELYNRIVSIGDTALCQSFINKYPNSNRLAKIKKVWEEYEYHHLKSVDDCLEFITKYPTSEYLPLIDSIIGERAEILRKAMIENPEQIVDERMMHDVIIKYGNVNNSSLQMTVSAVKEHLEKVIAEREAKEKVIQEKQEKLRQDSIKKEEEAKKRAEYEKYGTDAKAWATAKLANTIASYNDYLKRYPRGKHVDEANKYIIDLEVQSVISSGDYGLLPPSQKISYGTGRRSTVSLTNNSSQTITIRYSGVKSMKIVLSSGETRSIILPSSTYKVVATATGVRSFYGTEDLTGGDYESVYYISTSRY